MNSKMTTNSQLPTEPKNKQTNKLSKQLEQEENPKIEITWHGQGKGWIGVKVQGIRSINGRYKIDRGRLRIV